MTALATSPKFEGACECQFTAESGPLLFASDLVHAHVLDVRKMQRRFDELLCKF